MTCCGKLSLPVILTMESSRALTRSGHWASQVLRGCCFCKRVTSWDPGFVTVSETPVPSFVSSAFLRTDVHLW